jgi:hypothetical protein
MTVKPLIFRDTVSPQAMAIDDSYQGVIAYANGRYAWPAAEVSRFLHAGKRLHKYDVNGSGVQIADVLDVERYDATPQQARGWVEERWATHSTAACYLSLDVVPELVRCLGPVPCYLIVAHWTGKPHIPELALPPHIVHAGTQYANLPHLGYDLLAIYSRPWLEGQKIVKP